MAAICYECSCAESTTPVCAMGYRACGPCLRRKGHVQRMAAAGTAVCLLHGRAACAPYWSLADMLPHIHRSAGRQAALAYRNRMLRAVHADECRFGGQLLACAACEAVVIVDAPAAVALRAWSRMLCGHCGRVSCLACGQVAAVSQPPPARLVYMGNTLDEPWMATDVLLATACCTPSPDSLAFELTSVLRDLRASRFFPPPSLLAAAGELGPVATAFLQAACTANGLDCTVAMLSMSARVSACASMLSWLETEADQSGRAALVATALNVVLGEGLKRTCLRASAVWAPLCFSDPVL